MNTVKYADRLADHPLGRLAILIVGIAILVSAMMFYPPFGSVVWWAFPTLFVLKGVWELYFHGADSTLSVVAGFLLVLGGISRALYQLVPMDEFTGTVANLILLFGVFAMMYAKHYRENE
ncbi:hypothetical protein ZOD2009_13411 [Haladaptatus paucihalophilus DX253]|uniref:Uncharacterized protein n=1 Tax=Haladaptatus paucihalophilus DX253 TaxID=797209 RepID=E7QV46_HALPU|nr:hypothetical protein [Haladaptatus paucihalophilus]EFW91564.1 hypothetical protein ZOD2009_13411 [Haladaptatus paucihalophilus DX253]SHL24503.1 hypothetical protein SAMN05444342_3399 [Haladaptatus paucihalophilus DX253]